MLGDMLIALATGVLLGVVTVNFAFSIATLLALEKARNGAIVAVRQLVEITHAHLSLLLAAMVAVGGIATLLAVGLVRVFSKAVQRVSYRALVGTIIVFIVGIAAVLDGWLGLLVLVVSSAMGLLAPLLGVKRSHAMACLLIPVILFFLG